MKKFIAIAALAFALEGGIVAVGATNAHAATACAQEDSSNCHWAAATEGNHRGRSFDVRDICSNTRKGKVCTEVIKYEAKTKATKEGLSFINAKRLPIDEYVKVTYLGWAGKDLTNGTNLWSVKSKVNRHRFHAYKIRMMTPDEIFQMGANSGANDLCQELGGTPDNGKCDIEFN